MGIFPCSDERPHLGRSGWLALIEEGCTTCFSMEHYEQDLGRDHEEPKNKETENKMKM